MAVAVTGLAFDNIEEGGDGLLLGFYRCLGVRIANRTVKECRVDENGRRKFDGPVKRKAGDPYFVDCNVTGANEGCTDRPTFSLKKLFEEKVLPTISKYVEAGGLYEGYLPVIQGDNAGPHSDAKFHKFVTDYCKEKGWMWEPQAPQMPHANNLDLAVFPAMSKRHTSLLSQYGSSPNMMAPADEIWRCAAHVWKGLERSTIARGFLHGHRILKKVVEHKGDNNFLQSKDFHTGITTDYYNTPTGIRKTIKKEKKSKK
jgi:hypothetical protein